MLNNHKVVVHFPKEIETQLFTGKIYGNFIKNSNHYNIIKFGDYKDEIPLGVIHKSKREFLKMGHITLSESFLIGYYDNGILYFLQNDIECEKKSYELISTIFSRNTGMLETDKMLNYSVIISGCGSVGSLVALELARSGVGNFLLVDNDILEYHNICRHQCDIHDVGKYKVDALAQRILNIYPKANIIKQTTILQRVQEKIFNDFCTQNTLIIGCTDNREGDIYANKISYLYNVPFISIGFWQRAFAGEIFYSIPNITPCYHCQFGEMIDKNSDFRTNANHRFYVNEKELKESSFEPGISTDINFVTTIGIKLSLDLLNKKDDNYIPKIINNLTQYTFICNTNDTRVGGKLAEIFAYPLQVTTSLSVKKNSNCPICSKYLGVLGETK